MLALAVQDTKSDLTSLLNANGWKFPVALVGDDTTAAYGVRAIPTYVVIDSLGRVAKTIVGRTTEADLASLVNGL